MKIKDDREPKAKKVITDILRELEKEDNTRCSFPNWGNWENWGNWNNWYT